MPIASLRERVRTVRRQLARRRSRSARRLSTSGLMWAAVGLAFVAVAALGVVGFEQYQQARGLSDPASTSLYKSLQLFVLESGAVDGRPPWQLQIARFAAPLVASYAIVQTLSAVFREQVESLRLRHIRDHVVIAGLGRKGTQLAHSLLHRGDRVVVVEADTGRVELETVRAIGGLVVVGDARDPATQRRARVGRASHLVALCGDDGTNIEVTARAREQSLDRRTGTLRCVADLDDPALCLLLSIEEFERYGQAPVHADFVNTYAGAMQSLLRTYPPFRANDGAVPWVLVIGTGPTARHLLTTLARAWGLQAGSHDEHRLA